MVLSFRAIDALLILGHKFRCVKYRRMEEVCHGDQKQARKQGICASDGKGA
jgi:hypothetical protein